MNRWYVVHTQPHRERLANEHLDRQGFDVYLPLYAKQRRHARRVETISAPLFPGYIFVHMDPRHLRWRSINGTIGVIRLVCQGDQPAAVPAGIVENLLSCEDDKGLHSPASLIVFDPGDRVRIIGGAFGDRVGVYERMTPDERVILLLDLLGREIKIRLPIEAVEAA